MENMSVFLLIIITTILLLTRTSESTLTPSNSICSSNYSTNLNKTRTPTSSSSYKSNLKLVLDSLSSNSKSRASYYNTTSARSTTSNSTVYGSFMCRGDLGPTECNECVANVTKSILTVCQGSRWGFVWYDQCMVRYSNHDYFSTVETEPQYIGYNPENVPGPEAFTDVLEKTIRKVIKKLRNNFSRGDRSKYATLEAKVSSGRTLYSMAQCVPDLNVTGCVSCLEIAGLKLRTVDKGKIGGRALLPSCFVRFEVYPFYEVQSRGKRISGTVTAILIITAVFMLLLICIVGHLLIRRNHRKRKKSVEEDQIVEAGNSELHALQFPLHVIEVATNNFSSDNKLGEGGFGSVYKGKLPSGQELAAKRLSRGSGQGVEEFKNEVELVAKLQHKNLVRLLGFCLERQETILVYEYVPNRSLDHYLFDPKISGMLDWSKRYKIMFGVARGLLYLHEDSRLRIIHRDLKASNILLDADMNPKISDFGMARIFGADQVEASTNRIVGTYGYMSPEYIMFGHFSTKSDVFSFGVLVLEIITGKKNSSFQPQGFDEGLLGFVWKHWTEGIPSDLVDPSLGNSYSVNELIRCIHIGLLCIQDDMEDRPTMDSVVLLLNSDSISLPLPQRPTFFFPSRKLKDPIPCISLGLSTEKPASTSASEEGLHKEPN